MKKMNAILSLVMLASCVSQGAYAMERPQSVQSDFIKAVNKGDFYGVEVALQRGAKVNGRIYVEGFEEPSALELAAGQGFDKIAKLLIKYGANVNARDQVDETALHLVAGRGRISSAELLLANGADVNAQSIAGVTPLMLALKWGHAQLARKLIEAGANVNIQDKFGRSVLNYAEQSDSEAIKALIPEIEAKMEC